MRSIIRCLEANAANAGSQNDVVQVIVVLGLNLKAGWQL